MNILLWVMQAALGLYFVSIGVVHFFVPPGLPEPMAWMYDLSPALHYVSGVAEILGGLGLILPGLTRLPSRLTYLAALGLVLVMFGAAAWHFSRGEMENIVGNLVMAGLAGFVAFGRWKLSPLKDRARSRNSSAY